MVLVLGTVDCPCAIFAGLKLQVAPPPQLRLTISVKVAGVVGEKDIGNVVVVVPMGRTWVRLVEVKPKVGLAVPDREMLDLPLAALSVTTRLPRRVPVLVGVKVTWNWQL